MKSFLSTDPYKLFLKYSLTALLCASVFSMLSGCGVSSGTSSSAIVTNGSSSGSGPVTGSTSGSGTGSGNSGSGSSGSGTSGSGSTSGGAGSNSGSTSGNATVLSNLQTAAGNWRSWGQVFPDYVNCAAPCSESTWQQVFGVDNPSLSGNATMFELDPNIPYANVLFSAGLIGQNSPQLPDADHALLPTLHHFIYDADFYVTDPAITQSLEFDLSLWMSGIAGMTFGHQCDHLGDDAWDIWNNGSGQWVSTGVPCQFVQGWNHLTLQVQLQPDNSALYQSITLNGTVHTLNIASPAGVCPQGWWGLAANYQMDSNFNGAQNTTYLDNFSVSYW